MHNIKKQTRYIFGLHAFLWGLFSREKIMSWGNVGVHKVVVYHEVDLSWGNVGVQKGVMYH